MEDITPCLDKECRECWGAGRLRSYSRSDEGRYFDGDYYVITCEACTGSGREPTFPCFQCEAPLYEGDNCLVCDVAVEAVAS